MDFLKRCLMLWQNHTINMIIIMIIVFIISFFVIYNLRCGIKKYENQNNNTYNLNRNERKAIKLVTLEALLAMIISSLFSTLIGAFVKSDDNVSEDSSLQEVTSYISTSNEYEQASPKYEQILDVSTSGSYAKLTLYEWDNEWIQVWSANGCVGSSGIGDAKEGRSITPSGTFKIGFAYGISDNVETNLKYIKLSENSVWVNDVSSNYYNVLTEFNLIGDASYEPTYQQFLDGKYSINIYFENNGDGLTPGGAKPRKGSVITLCGYKYELKPTAGCIDISSADMTELLKYLDSEKNPNIYIH